MIKFKTRKQKFMEYEDKYKDIPREYKERLEWMYDNSNMTESKIMDVINKKSSLIDSLYYTELFITLYEEPEGTPRPRARLINRYNMSNMALKNSSFIQVYSISGREDNLYMKRLLTQSDFDSVQGLIYTPCNIEYTTYFKTPKVFNTTDTFLAELGIIRPITKPDWDNLGKKYSDMYNNNVWLDDTLVIDGIVRKFYSILPRIEIRLKYMNMLYNKYQYNATISKLPTDISNIKYFGKESE